MYQVYQQPSDLWGLKYIPVLENYSMDADGPMVVDKIIPNPFGFQAIDRQALREEIIRLGSDLRYIMEIGVSIVRIEEESKGSTQVILENKPADAIYVGFDINDHGGWVREHPNCYFFACDSENMEFIEAKLKEVGMPEIDLYLIDGWHSVNKVLKEWRYTKWLSRHGSVVMHDISCHPCGLVFDAIDEELFDKRRHESNGSWGLGIAVKK